LKAVLNKEYILDCCIAATKHVLKIDFIRPNDIIALLMAETLFMII
jgi:hypothetical protein